MRHGLSNRGSKATNFAVQSASNSARYLGAPVGSRGGRGHLRRDALAKLGLRDGELVRRLQIEAEPGAVAEIASEPHGGLGRNVPLAVNVGDAA
jgi:hypothetical protein